MIVYCVNVYVKEAHIDEFITATTINHAYTVKEPGNLRFDVLRHTGDPSRFMLYEVYESDDAAAEHKKTPHYLKWRERVADWMAQPREGVSYTVVCPKDRDRW